MAVPLKEKIKTIIELLKDPALLRALLSLRHSQYFIDVGWINSFKSKTPVDKDKKPIPWLTYPFIDFITPRLQKDMIIFEFGSGNSTLFYAERVGKVVTVEHNVGWFEKIKKEIPSNVELILSEMKEDGTYAHSLEKVRKAFDIIVVDGEDRNNCIKYSLVALKDDGVVVLDDSEREEYKEAIDLLKAKSFKRIDFWGLAANVIFRKCTTVFYRSENCLGI